MQRTVAALEALVLFHSARLESRSAANIHGGQKWFQAEGETGAMGSPKIVGVTLNKGC
jgi:hypothetical protein